MSPLDRLAAVYVGVAEAAAHEAFLEGIEFRWLETRPETVVEAP